MSEAQVQIVPLLWDGKVGDAVEIDHPKCVGLVYRVTKINPASIYVEDAFGTRVRTDRYLLKATDEPFTLRDPAQQLTLGTVVTFTRAAGVIKSTTDRYVVIKTGGKTVNVARLGGDGGKYVRVPNVDNLRVVEP